MIRKIMTGVFAAMLAVSLIWLAEIGRQGNAARKAYGEAVQLAETMPAADISADSSADILLSNMCTEPEISKLQNMDMDALREINPDVIGWIRIPDTVIDYPLLRGEDNEYYLKHNWQNKQNTAGAIFMEQENAADFSDFNTIIYGHNMRNGAMFGRLKEYCSQAYRDDHPHIYILHQGGVFRYDIFAAHEVKINSIAYAMNINDANQRAELIRFALENSGIKTDAEPDADDRIITLSTCTGDSGTRWVVQGVLNEEQSYYNTSG